MNLDEKLNHNPIIAVVGGAGCGKSTFAFWLAGLINAQVWEDFIRSDRDQCRELGRPLIVCAEAIDWSPAHQRDSFRPSGGFTRFCYSPPLSHARKGIKIEVLCLK